MGNQSSGQHFSSLKAVEDVMRQICDARDKTPRQRLDLTLAFSIAAPHSETDWTRPRLHEYSTEYNSWLTIRDSEGRISRIPYDTPKIEPGEYFVCKYSIVKVIALPLTCLHCKRNLDKFKSSDNKCIHC